MNFMKKLSSDQVTLIARLPYRAGLLISQSDQSGGDLSDAEELQVLSNLINGYAEGVFGSETVQYVLTETLKRREEWDAWGEDLNHVESECEKAVDILRDYVDPKEVSAFKKHIMEIAESVALAFREIDEHLSVFQKIQLWLVYSAAKKRAAKTRQAYMSFDQFLNISMDERKALQRLAAALGATYS